MLRHRLINKTHGWHNKERFFELIFRKKWNNLIDFALASKRDEDFDRSRKRLILTWELLLSVHLYIFLRRWLYHEKKGSLFLLLCLVRLNKTENKIDRLQKHVSIGNHFRPRSWSFQSCFNTFWTDGHVSYWQCWHGLILLLLYICLIYV